MKWFAQAPSNIALIKYMGKRDESHNIPTNPSLSYTLDNLSSFVEVENSPAKSNHWERLDLPGAFAFSLSDAGQQRFLAHLDFLKHHFNHEGHFIVRSCNNFPMGSGLASSASSFAALTKAACRALADLTNAEEYDNDKMAALSREGSGSSCRSFYSPWALWDEDGVRSIEIGYDNFIHECIVISHEHKSISSSEAHRRVKTSPRFEDRPRRAAHHLQQLLSAFEHQDWSLAFQICWQEFHDMHDLFATAKEPFHYISQESKDVLNIVKTQWDKRGDGPLVTMDAGPNIHLLYRPDQADMAKQMKHDYFHDNYDLLEKWS